MLEELNKILPVLLLFSNVQMQCFLKLGDMAYKVVITAVFRFVFCNIKIILLYAYMICMYD